VRSFDWPVRVYYEDTDAGGIVYHASYLRFAERARTEWLRALGIVHADLLSRFGCLFAVRRCRIDFRRPARLDDALVVATSLIAARGARLELRQDVLRAGELLVGLDVELALLGPGHRPARLPPDLRTALQSVTGAAHAA
jgi:acyl-CoA thioester hydrolase